MISTRRYLQEQINSLHKEIDNLDKFNQEVYTRKHEELVNRIAFLENRLNTIDEVRKKFSARRTRIFATISILVAVLTFLILFLDQLVIDHIIK